LCRTWITVAQAEIGIDDADQIQFWKMMPLGNELCADDEIEASCRHVVELLPQALNRLHQIARQYKSPRLRKQLGRLLFETLHAGADGRKAFGRVAIRTLRRRRHVEPAMMADQPTLEPVIDQPGIAIRTLQPEPAGPAQRERRITAAIEK